MTKFDNYIYYSICEKTLELKSKTFYMSYSTFCQGLKSSFLLGVLDKRETSIVSELYEYLRLLYGLNGSIINEYIIRYFIEEKWETFEEPVRLINEYYSNSFN